ncbi:MAG: Gldg family protein [Bacteroidia bacterium]|nr:Gldg family protein [Bacteroidia bacterium]
MKTTWKIAKAELQYLFYSPVAWLIFVIFTLQAGLIYCGIWDGFVRSKTLGYALSNITYNNFVGWGSGFFMIIQNYLYLFIPLLTMGIMSRELSSGSINLLYSSPVSNSQIIGGKYLALVIYAFSLVCILIVYSIISIATIENVDIPLILSGLLGVFLLTCAYSAIGLFMSSLTAYQVVAAITTITTLAVMNYIKGIGQDIEFIRDITYWISPSGRSDNLIAGLICSEDVIYFIAIITLFISFAIITLKAKRERLKWYVTIVKYLGVFVVIALIGYASSRPKLMSYYDTTHTKQNTLTKNSQNVIAKLKDELTITTYNNLLEETYWYTLPRNVKEDMLRFKEYVRFKPDIKLKYVNYYRKTGKNTSLEQRFPNLSEKETIDTLRKLNNWKFNILSPEEVLKTVDLEPEGYQFVRLLERKDGQRTFLRIFDDIRKFPFEAEITAAMKRLVMDELPVVGFVAGHGEWSCYDGSDRGYRFFTQQKNFRYSLVNQGFDFEHISLKEEVPQKIKMLVIADPKEMLSEAEMENLNKYIDRGDNLMILGEPGNQQFVNPITEKFGVKMLPGVVVKPGRIIEPETRIVYTSSGKNEVDTIPAITIPADLMVVNAVDTTLSYYLKRLRKDNKLVAPSFCALEVNALDNIKYVPWFATGDSWIESDLSNLSKNDNLSSVQQLDSLTLIAALARSVNGKEQRILISGDSEWLNNKELVTPRNGIQAANYYLINAAFFWLSNEEVPIDVRRPSAIDRNIKFTKSGWAIANPLIKWGYPGILLIFGVLIWIRRRGR